MNEFKKDRINMKNKLIVLCGLFLLNTISFFVSAQSSSSDNIENVEARLQNDTLFVSFDLITFQKVESVWVEIRTQTGKIITNSRLDGKINYKVVAVPNSKIIWTYAFNDVDLAGQDILINVKANIAVPAPVIETPALEVNAKYPLFRPGIELTVDPGSFKNEEGNANLTITFEYIAKPNYSILSGIGVQANSVDHENTGYSRNDYLSAVLPLTIEYKYNTGRWFRAFAGGGVINRYVFQEDDDDLNFGQGLNRYVLGAKAEAGVEIKNIRIGATFTNDLTSYSVLDEKISYLGLTLGCRFGGSKAYTYIR